MDYPRRAEPEFRFRLYRWSWELFGNGKFRMEARGRVLSSPDVEGACLDGPRLCLWTPEFEFILPKRKLQRFCLSRLQ